MNEIRKTIILQAPVQRVWMFLTDPQKLSSWLMDSDFTPVTGSKFSFTSPPSGRWDGTIHCEVRDIIENEQISYTWCANDIGVTTLVTFNLEASREGTRLTLVHAGLERAQGGAMGRHAAGWTRCLKALQDSVDGKVPGYDWSELQVTYFVDAPVQEVYQLWATANGMQRFWAEEVTLLTGDSKSKSNDDEFENGDRVRLRFTTQSEAELEILNIETNKFVLFSFGEDYGWVQVSLSVEAHRTRVVLRQFGLPNDIESCWEVHANARGWWISMLMNIQSVLLHGYDLRVREPEAANGLGAAFQIGNKTTPVAHDWRQFDVHLYMDAAPAAVLQYWQTVEGLPRFFVGEMTAVNEMGDAIINSTLTPGSHYRWRYIHDYRGEGQFLEVTDESVKFSFGGRYQVKVRVSPWGRGTLLHLQQSGMRDEEDERVHGTLNCRSCWVYFLVNLKSVVETGVDLRDHDPATADAISVGFNLV